MSIQISSQLITLANKAIEQLINNQLSSIIIPGTDFSVSTTKPLNRPAKEIIYHDIVYFIIWPAA
ncbi:MAG: hypothetical protein WCG01_01510 [bacterium]